MSFWDIFRPLKTLKTAYWRELGAYQATFSPFGSNIWNSDLVRSCVRAISEHTSKANAVSYKKEIAKILNESPNMYMSGKDFLSKPRASRRRLRTVEGFSPSIWAISPVLYPS